FGPEPAVRAVLGSSGTREVVALAGSTGAHLLSFAITGIGKLQTANQTPSPDDPSAAAIRKLTNLAASLGFDETVRLAASFDFSTRDAASTFHSVLQTTLSAARSAEDKNARDLATGLSGTLEGSRVNARLEVTVAQTGRIVRDAER